jgi:Uma2 family endonuclease
MSSQPVHYFSVEEYLQLEREASYRSEYFDGEIFAMAGASRRHNLISINPGGSLNAQLTKRECEVYVSNMRVRVEATDLLTYPDVVVVCGEPRFHDEEADTLLNPTLIIEVLSKSTSRFDRGEKFEHYRAIESFVEYLLIAQDKVYIEHYIRQPDMSWLMRIYRNQTDAIHLPSIHCDLTLSTIYNKVKFTE